MPDASSIGPTHHAIVGRITPNNHLQADRSTSTSQPASEVNGNRDRVEISQHAQFLKQLRELPDVRQDRVSQVRDAISEGRYETDERLNIALDRLVGDLD